MFEALGAAPDLAEPRAALDARAAGGDRRLRRRPDGRRRCAGAADRGRGGDAGAARARGGDGAARGVRRAGRGRSSSSTPAGRFSVLAAAGCDADGARALAAAALRQRPGRRAALVIEPIGRDAGRPAVRGRSRSSRPLAGADAAAVPHALRGAAPGVRSVPGARPPAGGRARRARAAARAAAARVSSAPAPRCSASPIRSSGCRATT